VPRKSVAIRGLDTELYNEVFSMAKKDGKRVSEVVNQALSTFLNGDYVNNNGDGKASNIFTLKNDGEITLSKKDIVGLKGEVGRFRIETSGKLVFEKDLDKETLNHIDKVIVHDGTVEVSKNLYPYLLMRSEIFGKIEKY